MPPLWVLRLRLAPLVGIRTVLWGCMQQGPGALSGERHVPGVVKMWGFVGEVVYGPSPAEAGIGPIGGQTPAETSVHTTFPPKLHLFTTHGSDSRERGRACVFERGRIFRAWDCLV